MSQEINDIIVQLQAYDQNTSKELLDAQDALAQLKAELAAKPVASGLRAPYPVSGGPYGPIDAAGRLQITKPGTVLQGFDFPCWIDVAAADVAIVDATVRSSPLSEPWGVISMINTAALRTHIENVLIVPTVPQIHLNGVFGHDYSMKDVEIMHVTDGISTAGDNFDFEDIYVHDLVFWSPDSSHAADKPISASHNDCWQHHQGKNARARRLRFHAFFTLMFNDPWRTSKTPNAQGGYNSAWEAVKGYSGQTNACLMATNAVDFLIEDSEFLGGGTAINVAPGSLMGGITTRNMRYGKQIWASTIPAGYVHAL